MSPHSFPFAGVTVGCSYESLRRANGADQRTESVLAKRPGQVQTELVQTQLVQTQFLVCDAD